MIDKLTECLKTPEGTQRLFPIQALALAEIAENRGGVGSIQVGGGKTLITQLAPVLLGAERPLLIVPAALRDQTLSYVIPELKKHWRLHRNLRIISYECLSMDSYKDYLDDIKPDMVLCDECQMIKNLRGSGRAKRITRYLVDPEIIFVALSGTLATRSIMNYQHILLWALKPINCPVPWDRNEATIWANALDIRVRREERCGPGVLKTWMTPEHDDFREAYRDRLLGTPGFIHSKDANALGVSLILKRAKSPRIPQKVHALIDQAKYEWTTPDGELMLWAFERGNLMRQLTHGFYLKWKYPAPDHWLASRKAFFKKLRTYKKYNRRKLDTDKQIMDFYADNPIPEYTRWLEVKDDFEPETIPVWVDNFLIDYACKWLAENEGIVWVNNPDFGNRLAKKSKKPYFGGGNNGILSTKKKSVIASISAHGTGKNLQHQFSNNLMLSVPSAGDVWEQMLGRTHRHGQEADQVVAEVNLNNEVNITSFQHALNDCWGYEVREGQKQRLCSCEISDLRSIKLLDIPLSRIPKDK